MIKKILKEINKRQQPKKSEKQLRRIEMVKDKYKSINDAITSYKERIFCVEYYIDTKVYDTRNVEIVPVYTTIETGKGQTMEELHVNLND